MRLNTLSMGIIYMLVSSFCFALMGAFAKVLVERLPTMETVFFRAFVMVLIVCLICVCRAQSAKVLKKGGYKKLALRVVMGGCSMVAMFYNIATMPLGTAIAFAQSVPIYAVVMGVLFLGEKMSVGIMSATLLGFVGLLFISNPSVEGLEWFNMITGIFSGLSMAIAFVTLRSLKQYFDNTFLVLAFGLSTTMLGFLGMFLPIEGVGGFVMPKFWDWMWILAMGGSGTLAQYCLNQAYLNAPVGIVSPIDYSRIVFSVFLGVMLGDALPDTHTIWGVTLIIVSGLLIALPTVLRDLKKLG